MYEGLVFYGGREVFNMGSLMAYVGNGVVPCGVSIRDGTGTWGELDVALGQTWTIPRIDQPPWFDLNDEDTLDFAGVLPIEVTGLNGSPRTVEMVPRLGYGSLPGRVQRAQRDIGVTALLVGSTTCGIE